jgi:hypothetical protein
VWRFRRRRLAPRLVACAVGSLALGAPLRAWAQGEVGATECCLSLLFPIGARVLGLGGAVGARPDGGAVFINPASLARLPQDEFFVHNLTLSQEKVNTFTLLIQSDVAGSFALSYRLVDHGEQEATAEPGGPTGTLATFEQVLVATYATRVFPRLEAGISYKLYQFRIDCSGFCGSGVELSATTHGVDAGLQTRPSPDLPLLLGFSLTHAGFAAQFKNAAQADRMPAGARLAAAYEVMHHFRPDSLVQLWVSTDLVTGLRGSGGTVLNVGAELALENTVFLWAGRAGGNTLFSGFAVGVGLQYDRFDVNVAKTFASDPTADRDPFQVTFGVRF